MPAQYSFAHPVVAGTHLIDPHGFPVPNMNVQKILLSPHKQVFAKYICDISTHTDTNTNEIYGVVKVRTSNNSELWFLLNIFLKGRKDRIPIHKEMLYTYLDKYFAHRKNEFHPIFARSEIRLSDKKTSRINYTNYPGLIITYDAKHPKPIGAALFENDKPYVCDIHDAAFSDVVMLDAQSILSLDQFITNPGIPRSVKHILSFPSPYKEQWIESVQTEMSGIVIARKGLEACSKNFMYDTVATNPKSIIFNIIPRFTIKADGRKKTRFVFDGHMQRISLQQLFGSTSPYVVNFYSPSVCPETMRIMLWLMVQFPIEISSSRVIDYTQAYLNSKRTEKDPVFCRLPAGIEIEGQKQAIAKIYFYGMLDAGKMWWGNLHESLLKVSEQMELLLIQNNARRSYYIHLFHS